MLHRAGFAWLACLHSMNTTLLLAAKVIIAWQSQASGATPWLSNE